MTYTYRQSDLSQFDFCLERGRALYQEEVTQQWTDSLALGSAFHAGIEASLLSKRQGHDILSLQDMAHVFREEWDRVVDDEADGKITWTKYQGFQDIISTVTPMYGAWIAEVEPFAHPNVIETKLEAELTDDINLEGTVDMVDFSDVIWDWKTASRPYVDWEKQRWAVQPTVYSYLVHQTYGATLPITFRYAIMLTNGKVQHLVVTRTEEHFDWLRRKLEVLTATLESGQVPLPLNDTGWWCSDTWCPNWNNCKGSHHGGDDWRKVTKL